MTVGIHQPNFFPWFGYFVKITRSDMFVFLDDVQLVQTGGSYTNRTLLNIQGTAKYFTVPVKRGSGTQLINQCHFVNNNWQKILKGTLQVNYSKTAYFRENIDFLNDLISYNSELLSEFNVYTIITLTNYIGIKNNFVRSSSLKIGGSSTERLVGIVKKLHGDTYLSGKGAEKYQQIILFKNNQINLLFNEFEHPVYKQNFTGQFLRGLSILDILFNLGKDKVRELLLNLKY